MNDWNPKKLGFGLMRLPRDGEKISLEQTCEMADRFLAAGFTYFDTAWVYPGSEAAIGEALVKRHPRESYQLTTKLAAWVCKSRNDAIGQFKQSLQRTGAGYFDFYLLHNLGEGRTHFFEDYGLLFVGDTVAFRRIPRYDLMNSNVPELFESLLRLKKLNIPDNVEVFFGHGEHVSYKEMLKDFECFNKPLILQVKAEGGNFTELEDSYIDDGTIMLSMNEATKILGTSCFSSTPDYAVMYLPNMNRLRVKAGSSDADINGFAINMKYPAQLKDGKIYLPAKFLAQICKGFLSWSLTVKAE